MAVYIIFFVCLAIMTVFELFQIKIKQQNIIYTILILGIILVAGLRYGLEEDYWHYFDIFNGKLEVASLEIGFKLFNLIIHSFSSNFGIYCLIVAIISMGLKGKFLYELEYPFVALLCYYLRFYVLFELNAIRQGLAMTFVIIAIYYLKKNSIKRYIFFVVVATLFHAASIIALLGIIVKKINFKFKYIIIIYVACIVFRLLFFDTFISKFSPYINTVVGSTNNLIRGMQYIINSGDKMQEMNYFSLARVVIPGIGLYFISDKEDHMYFNLYYIGSILNLMFWGLDTIAFRIPAVFYIYEAYILNDALVKYKLFGTKMKDWIFTICFLCIAFCDIWTFITYLTESRTLVPYRSILGI